MWVLPVFLLFYKNSFQLSGAPIFLLSIEYRTKAACKLSFVDSINAESEMFFRSKYKTENTLKLLKYGLTSLKSCGLLSNVLLYKRP